MMFYGQDDLGSVRRLVWGRLFGQCVGKTREAAGRSVEETAHLAGMETSQWAAIESIAGKIGCTAETLRKWVRQGERDSGVRPGATTTEQQRIKDLEREVRELRKTNEILKLASAYFAQAELDRHHKK